MGTLQQFMTVLQEVWELLFLKWQFQEVLGAVIDLLNIPADENLDVSTTLFSESHGRYLITVKKDAVDKILSKIDVPSAVIGEVGGDSLL